VWDVHFLTHLFQPQSPHPPLSLLSSCSHYPSLSPTLSHPPSGGKVGEEERGWGKGDGILARTGVVVASAPTSAKNIYIFIYIFFKNRHVFIIYINIYNI